MTTTYTVVVHCNDCSRELNRTSHPFTASGLKDNWSGLVSSAPICTKPCPNGCRSTASDCNANTHQLVIDSNGHTLDKDELRELLA